MNVDQSITNINAREDDANTIRTEEFEFDDDNEERKDHHANGTQSKKPQF